MKRPASKVAERVLDAVLAVADTKPCSRDCKACEPASQAWLAAIERAIGEPEPCSHRGGHSDPNCQEGTLPPLRRKRRPRP